MQTIFNIIQSEVKGGGMENIFFDYSQIIKQRKDVRLICVVPKNFCHLAELQNAGIETKFLCIKGHFDIFAGLKLLFLIKKLKPDLVIGHNGRSFAAISFCKKFTKFKSLAVSHGGSVKRILGFDAIIAVAGHIEKRILKAGFKGQVKTIHNGHKILPFTKNPQSKNFTFGVLSRLSKEKNIAAAIENFKKFASEVEKNSSLIIAGGGNEEENLKNLVVSLGLEKQVSFIGWISDKKDFFNSIDVFLQPALAEPFGITILEGFNFQTPVIACNSFGPKEIITNNYSGYLFEEKDENSLFEMMKKAYLQQDDFAKITENASKELQEKFSFEAMAKNLNEFIF